MMGARILLCEDDPLQAGLIVERLDRLSCTVFGPMTTPQESLDAATHEDLDAALLDVSLEGGTIKETAAALEKRGIPFAFITGYGPETAPTVSGHPEHLVIPKPVSLDVLDEILASLLPASSPLAAQ